MWQNKHKCCPFRNTSLFRAIPTPMGNVGQDVYFLAPTQEKKKKRKVNCKSSNWKLLTTAHQSSCCLFPLSQLQPEPLTCTTAHMHWTPTVCAGVMLGRQPQDPRNFKLKHGTGMEKNPAK